MSITVKFFARLREQVGKGDASLNAANHVQSAWEQATDGMTMPSNTLCAINMQYVDAQACLKDGV